MAIRLDDGDLVMAVGTGEVRQKKPVVYQEIDGARRLIEAGYERHEVLHMLGSVVAKDVYAALRDKLPPDLEKTREALAALPESWELQRDEIPAQRHLNRAERRASARKHRR